MASVARFGLTSFCRPVSVAEDVACYRHQLPAHAAIC